MTRDEIMRIWRSVSPVGIVTEEGLLICEAIAQAERQACADAILKRWKHPVADLCAGTCFSKDKRCSTCDGSRVDPGGLVVCRDCAPASGPTAAHMNQTVAQPQIDYSIVSAYADKHRLHFKGLCDMVRSACGAR